MKINFQDGKNLKEITNLLLDYLDNFLGIVVIEEVFSTL
jgi:hypothetical protein